MEKNNKSKNLGKSRGDSSKNTASKPKKKTEKKFFINRDSNKTKKAKNQTQTKNKVKQSKTIYPVKIIPLGGLNEIGKNLTLIEYNKEMIIIDCGMTFPDADMPGVDSVIPDFSYIVQNAGKLKGIFITHGHEDHIGGLPYLLKLVNAPVYATSLTIGLIEGKLKEHGIASLCKLNTVKPKDVIKLSEMSVEFIHVNHSIPDATALAITTPAGKIVHTGDFKIDTTPIDADMIDLSRFAELGKEGVLAMMSDSTNATRPGYTMSEKMVGESFANLFLKAGKKRILIATFSSNIHRIQQIIDSAEKYNRKVAIVGRSMQNVVQIAADLGYLNLPEGILVNVGMLKQYTDDQLVIITTGSQGEPMSALYRMALSDHRKVELTPKDFIIISASPIPGNEKLVTNVIDELLKLGAEVIYDKTYGLHVSGHACQEEQKILLSLVNPKYFIPVHGQQMHLKAHAQVAKGIGIDPKNILITDIGKVVELTKDSMKVMGSVQAGSVMVDGLGVGDVGSIVLNDRKKLAEDGIIIVVATIDSASGCVVSGPSIVSRGFVYVRESEELMKDATMRASYVLDDTVGSGMKDWVSIKNRLKDELSRLMYDRTKRNPMILPIIMEI
jgi:ribonuclease J